jgi:phage terminase large subunit
MLKGRINFAPKPHQKVVLEDRHRHRAVCYHRRAGKTVMAVFDGFQALLTCKKHQPRVAYIAPFLKQAKKLAWDYMRGAVRASPAVFSINESELSITFEPTQAKFFLLGADNIDAIRGLYFDAVVIDEVADCDPRLWPQIIRPALADRQGRGLLMGTPKGRMNILYELSKVAADDPEWSYHCYNCYQTEMILPDELAAMKREMSQALFAQEMECSFNAAGVGAVYGSEMNELQSSGRLTTVKYDKTLPIVTAWDLGFADATAIWVLQVAGSEVRAIAYQEHTLTALPDVIRELRRYGDAEGWDWFNARHIGPHDLRVRELGSGRSREDILSSMGMEFEIAPNWALEDGIEAVRMLLPHVWIDERSASRGLECLINYSFSFDERNRAYKTVPSHDWTSHGCDALRMFAVQFDSSRVLRQPLGSGRRGVQGWLF